MTDIVERLRAVDHMSVEDCFLQSPLFSKAAAEIERLRSALREIVDAEVYGFDILDSYTKNKVFCEGTDRFAREQDLIAARRIARAALEGKG